MAPRNGSLVFAALRSFVLVVVIAIGLVAAIIMMIGVYLAGIAVPHLLIGTGVEEFQGEERDLAQALYEQVASSLEGGEDELPVSALKVKSAERCPGPGPKRLQSPSRSSRRSRLRRPSPPTEGQGGGRGVYHLQSTHRHHQGALRGAPIEDRWLQSVFCNIYL